MNTQQVKTGHLDPTFNNGNPVYLNLPGDVHEQGGMATGRDGLIYVSGTTIAGLIGTAEFFIGALDAQGRWYEGFGSDGLLVGSFFNTEEPGVSVTSWSDALHYEQGANPADDRLYMLGRYIYKKVGAPESVYPAVACFQINGLLDEKFGTNGICIFAGLEADDVPSFALPAPITSSDSNGGNGKARDRSMLSWAVRDRRFYIQGMGRVSTRVLVLVVVIDFSGAIDWNFGVNGVATVEREPEFVASDIFPGDGALYLSGYLNPPLPTPRIATSARLDYNGVWDTSYGSNGFKDFWPEGDLNLIARLARLSTEYFVGVGDIWADRKQSVMLLSHDLSGNVNPHFNGGSQVILDVGEGQGFALTVEADAVVAVGSGPGGILVARFLHDGQLDTGFADGVGWRVITDVSASRGRSVIVRPDRSIVIWGGDLFTSVVVALTGQ